MSDLPEPLQPGDAVKLNNPDASTRGMGTAFDTSGDIDTFCPTL
ncbi:MAG: hypothetical protein VX936_11395 [Planctomycetota bacterium]|nr:hypothetical protein [Planctomycetota bacterium]MEC7718124.1 hypothetical protein [Planctomycetota bacterium]MEC8507485.1 hypothetical protein [Planctomycetota bacterium]